MTASSAAQWARAYWAAAEPFTIAALFTPEAGAVTEAAGLPARAAYVVMRAAPLGAAHPSVVTSAFHGFPRTTLELVLPGAWQAISPADAVAGTHQAVAASSARQFAEHPADAQVTSMADLLVDVVADLDTTGRPLAAANAAVRPPDEPWARLWRAMNTLREYRGDAHVATLVAADLDRVEAQVVMAAWAGERLQLNRLRKTRELTDDIWTAARERLRERGLLTEEGSLTAAGHELRDGIEVATDVASARPFDRLGADRTREVWQFIGDLSSALIGTGQMIAVTPVGAPWPPPSPLHLP
jgi:helix-turn-helix protein